MEKQNTQGKLPPNGIIPATFTKSHFHQTDFLLTILHSYVSLIPTNLRRT